jgi:hypothetical protein
LTISQPLPVAVTVDLQPWANVTITSRDGALVPAGPLVTPCVVTLLPGAYRLSAENGNLTQPLVRDLDVAVGEPMSIVEPMPGFDLDAMLTKLLGPPR